MEKYMRHSTIQFGKNTVTKTAEPNLMRVEVEKTRRAHEIGKDCGLFRVPEVLDYDEAKGVAVFERLHEIKSIYRAIAWGKQYITLVKNLGASLAIIHRELTLPDDMCIPLPAEFSLSHNEVFLHGDLTLDNVCVGSSWPPIVVLDWQFTNGYGGHATYGTRYFDIIWFIGNLIRRPTPRFLFSNPVRPVAKAFIESYCQEAMTSWDSDGFAVYARQSLKLLMFRWKRHVMSASKEKIAKLLWPRSESIAQTFIESLQIEATTELSTSGRECAGKETG